MEINVIHSSCRNIHFCSHFFHISSKSPSTLFFTKFKNLHRSQKQKTSLSTKALINPLFRRFPATSCSLGGNEISTSEVVELDPSLMVKNKATEISPELKGTSIFLVGMNSTMKNNLGKLLADVLRYYYFDSDSLVEQVTGSEYDAKYIKERDEEGFHESETEVLKQLSSMGRLVVCAGDGAVRSSTNLALLRYGISLWVDVPLDMVAREVMAAVVVSNPDSTSEVLNKLNKLYEDLRVGYATADATISLQSLQGDRETDKSEKDDGSRSKTILARAQPFKSHVFNTTYIFQCCPYQVFRETQLHQPLYLPRAAFPISPTMDDHVLKLY